MATSSASWEKSGIISMPSGDKTGEQDDSSIVQVTDAWVQALDLISRLQEESEVETLLKGRILGEALAKLWRRSDSVWQSS